MVGTVLRDDDLTIFDIDQTETGGSVAVSRHDGAAIIQLAGEFDIYAAPLLREHCRRVREEGLGCVVDVREVSFVDSSVLGALLDARRSSDGLQLPFLLVLPEGRHAVARAMADAKLRFEVRSGLGEAVQAARAQRRPAGPASPP